MSRSQHKPRPPVPPGTRSLPARFYVDRDWFDREMEHYFGRGWSFVGHVGDGPGPGEFVRHDPPGDSVLLIRDEVGTLRAFHNVCRHRGTRLVTEPRGSVGDRGAIRCPYHAWAYACDGRLTAAPHMDGTPDFDRADYPLRALDLVEREGLIWIKPEGEGPSFGERFGSLIDKFRPWNLARLKRGARRTYDVAANWKLILQNYSECLHCPTNHPLLKRVSHYLSGENEPIRGGVLGGAMDLLDGAETMNLEGRRRRLLEGLGEEHARRVFFYAALPNLLISPHPDYALIHRLRPIAPDRTEIVCDWLFDPEDVDAAGFDPSSEVAFWDQTNREDWRLSELTQLGMSSRGYRPGPFSCREDLLHQLDRMIVEEVGGDDEGRGDWDRD